MKKQYKIHDFVVGMKVKLDSGVTGEVRSIYGMSNDMFIRGLEKSYSCTEVQEILFDPRTGKYAQDENPNATKEKPISLPDLDWACKNGVFRKEDGTWHIPDGYIKPGIKVKGCDTDSIFEVTKYNPESEIWNCTYSCARGRRTNSFYSIQMSLKVNGPEWSWVAADTTTKGMPIYPNMSAEDFSIEYGPVVVGNKKTTCDCGAAKARTTHSTWCSRKGN